MKFNSSPGTKIENGILAECDGRIEQNSRDINYNELGTTFNSVLFSLTNLINLIHEKEIPLENWMKPAEVLLLKLCLHSSSIKQSVSPVPIIKDKKQNIITVQDISSTYVLSRAQIECYLTLHYFIFSPESIAEGEFKQLLYKLSGLCNRQNYLCTLPESLDQKDEEANSIIVLRQAIENNSWYQNLSPDIQKKVKKANPPARLLGWEDVIKSCRINEKLLISPWKLYSNHAHSEFIGTLQLQDYLLDSKEARKTIYHTLEFNLMILCVTIIEVLNLFPSLISDYEASTKVKDRAYIHLWSKVAFNKQV